MNARRWAGFLALLIGISTTSGFARVESDPRQEYVVHQGVGPWMICVSSFAGSESRTLANQLCHELRGRYDLPAFIYNRGEAEGKAMQDQLDREYQAKIDQLKKMGVTSDVKLRPKKVRVEDQWAVLVGGYKDADAARSALDQLRKLEPPKSKQQDPWRDLFGKDKPHKDIKVNPFLASFVVRNPSMPAPKLAGHDEDLLKKLNADESYSLLQNPKPWTLLLMEFNGSTSIQSQFTPSKLIGKVKNMFNGDMLDMSARQAHEVARALREMKFEAYVLHSRYGSSVTVGGFDGPNDPRLRQQQQLLATVQFGNFPALKPAQPIEVPRVN